MAVRHVALAALGLLPASAAPDARLEDLHLREALYYAYQESWFDALERLDAELVQHHGVDEPWRDALHPHVGLAEFSVGDFELRYRMHHRAGRAIRAVLEADVDESVRNDAAFRLARIHFQKGRPGDASHALERIRGRIPEEIRDDVEFLRANVYLALERPADAVAVLERLQHAEPLHGFAAYNLGIALLRDGREPEAIAQLERAGRIDARDREALAIRDKSNLVLGSLLFDASAFAAAQRSLDRVRLDGPFSNQALLRAGWADVSAGRFERAVVPWSILAERDPTDPSVQEAMLAVAHAYGQLDLHGRAAHLYGRAVDTFRSELDAIDASIGSVERGDFLAALVREEIRHDADWVIRLRGLPEAPETFYLVGLIASHEFQTALQNTLDLEDLRRRLVASQRSLDAFDDLVRLRRDDYAPLLPEIDASFRVLDARMRLRLEQREHVARRLHELLVAPRPEWLATTDEQRLAARIDRLDEALRGASDPERAALQQRIDRLRGVLRWTLETRYHERLTRAHAHLRELDADVASLVARYDAFVRVRQAATQSYVGFDVPIERLRVRVADALERLEVLSARQGRALETVAVEELRARRARLETQLHQARFAFADSYDRAAKAQAR